MTTLYVPAVLASHSNGGTTFHAAAVAVHGDSEHPEYDAYQRTQGDICGDATTDYDTAMSIASKFLEATYPH